MRVPRIQRTFDALMSPPPFAAIPEPVALESVAVDTDVGRLWVLASDQVIRPYMEIAGTWEPNESSLLRSLIGPTTRFLDVGANVGYFSALAAQCAPNGSIDAIEPEPDLVSLLRLNLFALAPHATVWSLALGESRAVVALEVESKNPGNTMVDSSSLRASRIAAMVRGDELFAGRTFDVVKVDVQGFEAEVLRGMEGIIRKCRRIAVVAEFFPHALELRGTAPREVLEAYRALGLDRLVSVAGQLERLDDESLLALCARSGPNGFVNLLLQKNG